MGKKKFLLFAFLTFLSTLSLSNGVSETVSKSLDTVWVLLAASLVFFMQAGFALVESGFTRAKNSVNIIMKNLMDFAIGSVVFWIIGYWIMFGTHPIFLTHYWDKPIKSGK